MDAVRTAIMSNRFNAIVEEASAAVYRTAHTTFVKLVQDYQCAVATEMAEDLPQEKEKVEKVVLKAVTTVVRLPKPAMAAVIKAVPEKDPAVIN